MLNKIDQYIKDRFIYSYNEERICWRKKYGNKRGKPATLDELIYILNEYLTSLPNTSSKDQSEH